MRRGLWLPLLAGSLGTIALSVYLAFTAPMPGELAAAHSELGGAESVRRCGECHERGELRSGCLSCHEEIAAQLNASSAAAATRSTESMPVDAGDERDGHGYHAWVDRDGERSCAECHPDHLGEDFALVSERSYGPGGKEGFTHPHVSFDLHGAHEKLSCEACHHARWRDPVARADGKGRRQASFLGLDQTCERCHRDIHDGEFSQTCATCHTQVRFERAERFDHDDRFMLAGAHRDLACRRCHRSRGDRGDTERVRFDDTAGKRCAACHATPHTSVNAALYGATCERCHETRAFRDQTYTVADHAKVFPLRGHHADAACRTCHDELKRPLAGVRAESCETCHAGPHREGGKLVLAGGQACRTCHTEESWKLPGFGAQAHAKISLPLEGAHAEVGCAKCHSERSKSEKLASLTRGGDCEACHESPHREKLDSACTACHGFADPDWATGTTRITADQHARTGFPLAAPHADVVCGRCHASGQAYPARYPGRPAGACRSCHDDPHEPSLASSYPSCRDCHTGAHFNEHSFGLDRHKIYPLDGLHSRLDCAECHRPPDRQPEASRKPAALRGVPRWCAGCHTDPHGGQFGTHSLGNARNRGRGSDCAHCHTSTPDFRINSFDHEHDTSYPLRGAHPGVACNKCHVPWKVGGKEVRLYRGTPAECASCHSDPHRGTLTDRRGITCLECHDDKAWKPGHFDHETQSRFHLEGAHKKLDCTACHKEQVLSDGSRFVRYRPLGRRCEDCHGSKR